MKSQKWMSMKEKKPNLDLLGIYLFVDAFEISNTTVTGISISLVNFYLEDQNNSNNKLVICLIPSEEDINMAIDISFVQPLIQIQYEFKNVYPFLYQVLGDNPGQRLLNGLAGLRSQQHCRCTMKIGLSKVNQLKKEVKEIVRIWLEFIKK